MVFKFLRKKNILKKKKGSGQIDAAEEFPDFTPQQLVQRFHSESALCDPSHRRMLIEAAEETRALMQLHETTVDVKHRAAKHCQKLAQMQSSVTDLRASQQEIELRARSCQDHIAAHNAPIQEVLTKQTDEVEDKIFSLVEMTDMIQQAVETVEEDCHAVQQKRARSRSNARLRASMESKSQMGGCFDLDQEPSVSCMEFGPCRTTVDAEKPIAEVVKESNEYLDETARLWALIDPDALCKELADVQMLLEEYEVSTRRREERLAMTEQAGVQMCR